MSLKTTCTEKHELSKILFGDKINSEVADIKVEPTIEMYDNNDDIANEDEDIKPEHMGAI